MNKGNGRKERCKSSMNRREFLVAAGAVALAGCSAMKIPGLGGAGQRKANVVLIYADDLGYGDLGCQGSGEALTPNIDQLAANGTRFTDGYVTCSVCSPSRAGMITGRYQQRFGHEDNTGNLIRMKKDRIGLPKSEITLGQALKDEGYATGIIGKWHLGANDDLHPMVRGFDYFFGHLGGAHAYDFKSQDAAWGPIYRGREPVMSDEYLTDAFSREAVEFIDRNAEQPFFLYLAYNAVHSPFVAPQEYQDRFKHIENPKRRIYLGMLAAMDDGVGDVMQALRKHGIEDDTLVFFISDNGAVKGAIGDNGPLAGSKAMKTEGGIRIPYIIQWNDRIPAGQVYTETVSSLDVFPTAMAAAKAKLPADREYDGVNLVPYVNGDNKSNPHEILFWRRAEYFAMRKGKWKIVKLRMLPVALFDLENDIGETNDLAEKHPEILDDLMQEFDKWQSNMVEPLWEWHPKKK